MGGLPTAMMIPAGPRGVSGRPMLDSDMDLDDCRPTLSSLDGAYEGVFSK
jgi:hypothetical protein